jgi:archaeal type IV pilus assembly protein PilA
LVSYRNQDAVSMVIGTILMVAVTVILAEGIAMYMFGIPLKVAKNKVVTASAQMDTVTGNILITSRAGRMTTRCHR